MFQQFEYFKEYQQRLAAQIGAQQAKRRVNEALILITVGGNDFVNNYYLVPFSARSRQYNLPDYVKYVISEFEKLLQVNPIYYLGWLTFLVLHAQLHTMCYVQYQYICIVHMCT